LSILRLTRMPPNSGPGSLPKMKQVMPSGVRAARATTPARSPFVTHIFVPLMTYSSPSGTALLRRACESLPESGSDREKAPRISPVAMRGSHWAFCSSVPKRLTRFDTIVCVLSTPDRDIQPYASSSTRRA
jgi:hypothetical protein